MHATDKEHMSNGDRRGYFADTAFRVLFSLIFIVAGLKHVLDGDVIAHRLEAAPFAHLVTWAAPAPLLVLSAGVVLLLCGGALLVGFRTQTTALVLIAVLVPITITVQLGGEELGPLFKNVALLGGLIHFAAFGAKGASVDCVLSKGGPDEDQCVRLPSFSSRASRRRSSRRPSRRSAS